MKLLLSFLLTLLTLNPSNGDYEYKKIFKNNQLIAEGWEKDGQKERYWKYYFQNGQIEKEGHYLHDQKNNYWKYYFTNGQIQQEGRFKNDLEEKWWLFYNQKGEITKKCEFKHGKRHGYTFIYKNNELNKAEKYSEGELVGSWTDYASFYRDN